MTIFSDIADEDDPYVAGMEGETPGFVSAFICDVGLVEAFGDQSC